MCRICSVEGCNNKHHGKGYCSKHYTQIKRHGCITERTRFDANEIIEYDNYAEIVIYNKQCEEIARTIIDLDDVEKCKQYKWSCKSDNGYVKHKDLGYLHRFIMNASEDMVIDHANGNKLDNRKSNLRECTIQQNSFNKGIRTNNTSGVTGVVWDKSRNKWHAKIQINGKLIYLGTFKEKEDAIQARRQAEIDYFGEYRRQE